MTPSTMTVLSVDKMVVLLRQDWAALSSLMQYKLRRLKTTSFLHQ
jgi:hypothetical protein